MLQRLWNPRILLFGLLWGLLSTPLTHPTNPLMWLSLLTFTVLFSAMAASLKLVTTKALVKYSVLLVVVDELALHVHKSMLSWHNFGMAVASFGVVVVGLVGGMFTYAIIANGRERRYVARYGFARWCARKAGYRRMLAALQADKAFTGYPLSREAKVSSGLMYVFLSNLEARGLVDSYWGDEEPLRRRYYTLNTSGRLFAAEVLGASC